jgi:hypothetical protein
VQPLARHAELDGSAADSLREELGPSNDSVLPRRQLGDDQVRKIRSRLTITVMGKLNRIGHAAEFALRRRT